MPARRPWWLRGPTAPARFGLGGLYLVGGLVFLSAAVFGHRGQVLWFAVIWLVGGALQVAQAVARYRWDRSHPGSDAS